MKPNKSQDMRWTWLQMTEEWSVNMQIFRDSTRQRQSLDSKNQALTVKETMSKAHMQVHTNKESCEKQPGKKPGPNRAETGMGRPGSVPPLT
jgi:hypothetical protein